MTAKSNSLQARIVSGSAILLSGSGLTTAINLAYNIVVARFLGPQGFGHATVVYTILTLISAVTLSFQIISTKVVAQQATAEGKAAAYRGFHRAGWVCGIAIAVLLFAFQNPISNYLNLPSANLVALLAVGAAFYVPLGSRRGYVQGTYGFRRLATNLIIEGACRLVGSFVAILLGFGVAGVIGANSAAMAIAYLALQPRLEGNTANPVRFAHGLREITHAMVFFAGQVLINNCDIILVKHFFAASDAGLYAAVAMVGRVIFAFSSAVVNTTFPLVAGTREEDRRDLRVIATSLLLVLGIGSFIALGLSVTPAWVWSDFFGAGFSIAGRYSLPYLLALYALTTIVYSLSVVIITFEMSYKIANTSWVQLAFSAVVIAGICRYHASLHQVILVQLVLMVALLVAVALPFLMDSLTVPRQTTVAGSYQPVRLVRRVSEDEAISEFLKSDFNGPAFRDYQELAQIVNTPDFASAPENAKRRALLFLRHLALWKELPEGTEWWEVDVTAESLAQIRVFPRAQWRKLANGSFNISDIVEGMRTRTDAVDPLFVDKIHAMRDEFGKDDPGFAAVLLIGLNQIEPLTILDGNHRLVSALLSSQQGLGKMRFLCGLSPRMAECCWYNTNFVTLFRYGKNVLVNVVRRPETELARLLENTG